MTADLNEPVIEELFQNRPTGVEAEKEDDLAQVNTSVDKPWNPDEIRVTTKQFSLRHILDLIDYGDLELAPDFQRAKVWKVTQKSRLIESILLQIPLPAFYFAEDTDGQMRVVDGLQRLSTVHDFVRGGAENRFPLEGLEYLSAQMNLHHDQLPPVWQRRISNTQIVAHVIDPATPNGVKYDIFKRINTGGTPLNAQEIRHCMSTDRSRNYLKSLVNLPEFQMATGEKLKNHIRMDDREVALRFSAFWMAGGTREYRSYRGMDEFLDTATEKLDRPDIVSDAMLDEMRKKFRQAMKNCHTVFGPHAFRKWPQGVETLKPLNRPLFEVWSVELSHFSTRDVERRKDDIVSEARRLMTMDLRYVDAITSSTGTAARVEYRFQETKNAAGVGR
ncbi:DUF262 domain-containing protein [Streptomyces bacillaris]|uniref:DUF262 domain-containing protein n=1 Tax=Streptomyces TaxID=1883 RepID=UPI0022797F45|nr:DUF262 domain-containing protein [Streptomyces cavourensis]WAE65763.1 DUF262 domain-containing protein [Streptomyces cavourensis]